MTNCKNCGVEVDRAASFASRGWACEQCQREKRAAWKRLHADRLRAYNRAHAKAHRAEGLLSASRQLARAGGYAPLNMPADALRAILAAHSGRCDIPRCPRPAKAIDHDHATGDFRGILCTRHNAGLGHFSDSADELLSAVEYLFRKAKKS